MIYFPRYAFEYKIIQRKVGVHMTEKIKDTLAVSQKCSDTEDPFDKVFTNPLGLIFAKLFIKMNWVPNAVTICSMVVGVIGAVFFYFDNIWLNICGIILEILAAIFDSSDGQVARLTQHKSEIGRLLDGICDGLVFGAIYISITLRLMNEPVPFTNGILWGGWIWIITVFCSLISHASQNRAADYYRNLHIFVMSNGSEITTTEEVKKELCELKNGGTFIRKCFALFNLVYTKAQERQAPKTSKLIRALGNNGDAITPEMRETFYEGSRKHIILQALLTYNLRAYTLFILILFKQHVFFFPFVIIVMAALKWYMIIHYEKLSNKLYKQLLEGDNK